MSKKLAAALAGVMVLASALRFATLDVQSFWLDEGYTLAIMRRCPSVGCCPLSRDTESTPPLYYLLAWAWSKVFGLGEVGLRSLSALCGTVTVAISYLLARRVG